MADRWVQEARRVRMAVRCWWFNRQLDHLAWRIALGGEYRRVSHRTWGNGYQVKALSRRLH